MSACFLFERVNISQRGWRSNFGWKSGLLYRYCCLVTSMVRIICVCQGKGQLVGGRSAQVLKQILQ